MLPGTVPRIGHRFPVIQMSHILKLQTGSLKNKKETIMRAFAPLFSFSFTNDKLGLPFNWLTDAFEISG